MAMPPASRMPSRIRRTKSTCILLQGTKSLPVCAIPIIGLPERSSAAEMPKLVYRSIWVAVALGSPGISNHSRLLRRLDVSVMDALREVVIRLS